MSDPTEQLRGVGLPATRVLSVLTLLLISSCISPRDLPPERGADIVQADHYCKKCQSLQGGICDKGPLKVFPGKDKKNCTHEWEEVSRGRFKQLASALYDVDWSKDPMPFWNTDE